MALTRGEKKVSMPISAEAARLGTQQNKSNIFGALTKLVDPLIDGIKKISETAVALSSEREFLRIIFLEILSVKVLIYRSSLSSSDIEYVSCSKLATLSSITSGLVLPSSSKASHA